MTPVAVSLFPGASVCALDFLVSLFPYLCEAAGDRSVREGKALLPSGQFVSDKGVRGVRWLNILLQEGFAGARKIQLLQTGSTFLSPPPVSNVSCLFLRRCPCREQLGVHFSSHLLLTSASLFSLKKWEKLQGETPSLPVLVGSQGTGQNQISCLSRGRSRTLCWVG